MVFLGILGLVALKKRQTDETNLKCIVEREELREVIIRAGKVYLFIMALVFLGEGFKPLILGYVVLIPPEALYWANMVSAVLDNATLAAAEISPVLSLNQITTALVALLDLRWHAYPGEYPQHYRGRQDGDHQQGMGKAGHSFRACHDGRVLLYSLYPLLSRACMTQGALRTKPRLQGRSR